MTASLIKRLQEADGPDRELDALIAIECGLVTPAPDDGFPDGLSRIGNQVAVRKAAGEFHAPAFYTSSVDAVLNLYGKVLPGWRENKRLMLECDPHRGPFWQARLKRSGGDWPAHGEKHKSTALALILALLSATSQEAGE